AQEFTTANNLIQKDLEGVRARASQFIFPEHSEDIYDPITGVAVTTIPLKVVSDDYFTVSSDVQFFDRPDTYKITNVDTTNNTITIASPGITETVEYDETNNKGVVLVNNTLCRGSITTGLGAKFKDKISPDLATAPPGIPPEYSNYQPVSGYNPYDLYEGKKADIDTRKKLWLMRSDTVANRSPYDSIEVKYVVFKEVSSSVYKVLAEFSSEVIPNASFQCPKL
ncbi:MAG: hypothetical protein F6K62_16630, partial [Sphaerospermopsis sp. SIO1G2]|nr:hypothetical protein [Sphaerospermopsis sp. SIO1G2]